MPLHACAFGWLLSIGKRAENGKSNSTAVKTKGLGKSHWNIAAFCPVLWVFHVCFYVFPVLKSFIGNSPNFFYFVRGLGLAWNDLWKIDR